MGFRAEIANVHTFTTYRDGKVGNYFLQHFQRLNATFNAVLEQAKACSGCRVTVTGHSLGGAVASIAALELAAQLRSVRGANAPKVSLFTFGQPRTGNCAYARLHDSLVPDSWRVVNGLDEVVHVPRCTQRHVFSEGCRCSDDAAAEEWYHHGTEVW